MDGILLVIKPPDMTSFDVVAWLRKISGVRKIGHAGTLDPAACGLLPVCIGKATKAIEAFQNYGKSYRAEMVLGVVTNTQDGEGQIIEEKSVFLMPGDVESVLSEFVGNYEQVPPMFSAVKINGKRLYDLARQGIEVERKGREVTITALKLLDIKTDGNHPVVRFDVNCSKGTYIRTLCHDIGKKLGCGAHMSFLIRTMVGPFRLEKAVTLEEIEKCKSEGMLQSVLISADVLFQDYSPVYLKDMEIKRFVNGALVVCEAKKPETCSEKVRIYSDSSHFVGLGTVSYNNGSMLIKPEKLFSSI